MKTISCVVPCFNEEEVLPRFYQAVARVADTLPEHTFEFLFVDDGSSDNTLNIIKRLRELDDRVKYLSFSRNFGKEAAMLAGLQHASGDAVAVMDADLQHPPELLPQMIHALEQEGYDCCGVRRETRDGDSGLRSALSGLFYKFINKVSKAKLEQNVQDYQLMNRKMVDAVLSLSEYNRFTKGIFSWVGFRKKTLSCPGVERAAGQTKWNFKSLFRYAVEGLLSFTTAGLTLVLIIGLLLCAAGLITLIVGAITAAADGVPMRINVMTAFIVLLVGGIQTCCLGLVGQYLAKMYWEIKDRPVYIVSEAETEKQQLH